MINILLIVATLISGAIGSLTTFFLGRKTVQKQKEKIKELELKSEFFSKELEIINDIPNDLLGRMNSIIDEESIPKGYLELKNFGLDLENVMPWIRQKIMHSIKSKNLVCDLKSLLVNPESIYLKELIDGDSDLLSSTVLSSIEMAKNLTILDDSWKFKLELRQYDLPVIFYGFMLNKEHLFIGFTEIHKGKIKGGITPYIYLNRKVDNDSKFTEHCFRFYNDWFEYYWRNSKKIVSIDKS
jgi:hypothetical protein